MNETADDTQVFQNGMGCNIDYAKVVKACDGDNYQMSLVGDDAKVVTLAVNMGIDSRLQAVFGKFANGERSIIATSDTDYWKDGDKLILAHTLECEVEPESLPVLLRRLCEMDVERTGENETETDEGLFDSWSGQSLAESILMTLGFDDYGRFVGREAVGLE